MLPGVRPRFLPAPLKGRGAGRNMVAGHTLFLSGEKMMSRMVVFYLKCAHMTCLSLDVAKDRTAAPPFAPGGICRGWAAGVPSVPWNLPESGFCRADAQMAWLCCLGDCFGDATWAAWSNLRRPRHSTADWLLSVFRAFRELTTFGLVERVAGGYAFVSNAIQTLRLHMPRLRNSHTRDALVSAVFDE